jgi:hypothetical protein
MEQTSPMPEDAPVMRITLPRTSSNTNKLTRNLRNLTKVSAGYSSSRRNATGGRKHHPPTPHISTNKLDVIIF